MRRFKSIFNALVWVLLCFGGSVLALVVPLLQSPMNSRDFTFAVIVKGCIVRF